MNPVSHIDSNNHYKYHLDNINVHYWTVDNNFNLTYYNHSFSKHFNVPNLNIGINVFLVFKEKTRRFWKSKYSEAINGKTVNIDPENCLNNSLYSLELKPIIEDKKIIGVSAMAIDASTKKQERVNNANTTSFDILQLAPDAFFRGDNKGNIIDVNEETIQLTGFSKIELLKKNINELFHSDCLDNAPLRYDILKSNRKFISERRINTKKGNSIYIEMHSKKMPDGGYISFFRDITKRKITESKLISSELSYKNLFDGVSDAIYVLDKNGVFIDVNQVAVNTYGHSKEFFIGKTSEFISAPNNNDFIPIAEAIKRAYEGEKQELEFWGIKKGGTVFLEEIRLSHGKYNNEDVVIAMGRDITEKKEAEKKIEESEELFRKLTATTSSSIFIYQNNKFVFTNKATQELSGYSNSELLGMNFWDIIHNDYKDIVKENGKIRQEGGEIKTRYEFQITTKKRENIWIDFSADSIMWKGEPAAIGSAFNITEKKTLIDNLFLAKKKAEESDNLKTAFLQNMSHEIRTPLNGILGFSELLSSPDIDLNEVNEYSNVITKSGNRLLELINNILDISKIESKTIDLNITKFNLDKFMENIFMFFKPRFDKKNIKLKHIPNTSKKAIIVSTDSDKLNQVLTNLLNNALKFTNKGSVRMSYELSKDKILFKIKDTGIGFSEAQGEKLFERFYQVDNSLTRNFEGSGLGMAISKGIIEVLNGEIWHESEINTGTTFFFTIKNFIIDSKPKEKKAPIQKHTLSNLTILIAEDDEASYFYLDTILRNSRTKIIHAKNGIEAVDICKRNNKIDIILMDIQMPIKNGLDASREIKEIRPNLPIIIQSAFENEEKREEALKYGVDTFFAKPVNREGLIEAIKKLTNQ